MKKISKRRRSRILVNSILMNQITEQDNEHYDFKENPNCNVICKLKIEESANTSKQEQRIIEFLNDLKGTYVFEFELSKGVFTIEFLEGNISQFNYEIFLSLKRIVFGKYVYLNLENDL